MIEILKMTAFLVLICAVSAVALAFTDAQTRPLIEKHRREKEAKARKEVLPGAVKFEEVAKWLKKGFDGSGKALGWVGKTEAKGYGGKVEVLAGVDLEGKVTGVKVLTHQETPGLGTNAIDPNGPVIQSMLGQGAEKVHLKKDDPNGVVDAITGVTITSRSVADGVRKILDDLKQLRKDRP